MLDRRFAVLEPVIKLVIKATCSIHLANFGLDLQSVGGVEPSGCRSASSVKKVNIDLSFRAIVDNEAKLGRLLLR